MLVNKKLNLITKKHTSLENKIQTENIAATKQKPKTATHTDTQETDIRKKLILQEDGRCTNAFNLISDKEILKSAYLELKSKPGMMTKGIDQETLDGINQE